MIEEHIPGDEGPLEEKKLIAAAERASGLSDWGSDTSFLVGLRVLIEAVEDMAPAAAFRNQVRGRIYHILLTRLRMEADARQHPEIVAAEIKRPLVVIGLPRTGTTVTYDLLTRDPASRAPREWETQSPWPAPTIETFDTDPRIAALNGLYAAILKHAPELATIQRFDCTQPGECNHIAMFHFASTNFEAELAVPRYARWLKEERAPGLYRTHKRILQQLQWKGPRGRWTIKSPQHLLDLEGLLEIYPDACLVWTHRDPVSTFSSMSSMAANFQRAFGVPVDPKAVGASVSSIWSEAVARATRSRKNPEIERRIIDIPHRDVISDPLGTVKRIHQHFDIPFSAEHAEAVRKFLAESSAAQRLGKHRHTPEEYGLDSGVIRQQLADYYARFGNLLTY